MLGKKRESIRCKNIFLVLRPTPFLCYVVFSEGPVAKVVLSPEVHHPPEVAQELVVVAPDGVHDGSVGSPGTSPQTWGKEPHLRVFFRRGGLVTRLYIGAWLHVGAWFDGSRGNNGSVGC